MRIPLLVVVVMVAAMLGTTVVASSALAPGADERELTGSNGEKIEIDDAEGTYQIEVDGVQGRKLEKSSELHLRNATIDTADDEVPTVADRARIVRRDSNVYVVQFETHPLESYREDIEALGASVHGYIPDNAHLVEMNPGVSRRVANLEYVSEVLKYEAAHKIDDELDAAVGNGAVGTARYSILLLEDGGQSMGEVVTALQAAGIEVLLQNPETRRLEAMLKQTDVDLVLSLDQVEFMDLWTPPEVDVDQVRVIGGANHLESIAGYDGSGVRGAVVDSGLLTTHQQLAARPPLVIPPSFGPDPDPGMAHGTPVYGILFASGNPNSAYRGVLPEAQGIFHSYANLDRPQLFAQLTNPNGPYRAVFVSNSWGGGRTLNYTTTSVELDQLIFDHDVLTLQSQSNAGDQMSRPEAWAKNIVSVGAVNHYDTLSTSDDAWAGTASIGPASDGRIKPDLSFWYDDTRSLSSNGNAAYRNFGGTSGATPSTAGYFGLLFEMWADGVFEGTPGLNRDVFDSRPHASTAKALAINTAFEYSFSGASADLTRTHQGWGRIDARNAYDTAMSGNMPLIVDETNVLLPGQTHTYAVPSFSGADCVFRATMVYTDLPGTPSASVHRVNDLSLRVTAPNGTKYWGNNGLRSGNWSNPGGSSNTIDTVENVFLNNVSAGNYIVEVFGDAIVQDAHVETSALDADYGLVVSGSCLDGPPPPGTAVTIWNTSLDSASNGGAWSASGGGSHGVISCGYHRTGAGSDTVWVSQPIDISGHTNVEIAALLSTDGTGSLLEASGTNLDTISLRYRVDGGNEVIAQQGAGDIGRTTFRATNLSGSSLVVVIHADVTATNERYCIENVSVTGDTVAPPTPTPTATPTSTPTSTPTATATTRPTSTPTPTSTATATPTSTATATATSTATATATSTPIPTSTVVPTSTATSTPTATATSTATPIPTATSVAPTSTATAIPTATSIPTPTPTPTATPTATTVPTSTSVPTSTVVVPTPTSTSAAGTIGALWSDSFETGAWSPHAATNSAVTGQWEHADPMETRSGITTLQLEDAVHGSSALVTDGRAGGSAGNFDVDNGVVSVESPTISLPASGPITLRFEWYFGHRNATSADYLRVEVHGDEVITVLNEVGAGASRSSRWDAATADLSALQGQDVTIRILAADEGRGSLIEAGIDHVRILGNVGSVAPTATPVPTATSLPIPTPTPSGPAAFSADFESADDGWIIDPNNTDTAPRGTWGRWIPRETDSSGLVMQLGYASNGNYAFVTDGREGNSSGAYDIDGGVVSARSPAFTIPAAGNPVLLFDYYLAHRSGSDASDYLKVTVVTATESVVVLDVRGDGTIREGVWRSNLRYLFQLRGETAYLLVEAADGGAGGLVEAGVDHFRILANYTD